MTTDIQQIENQIAELQQKKETLLKEQRATKLKEVKEIIKQFGFTANELGVVSKTNKKGSGANKTQLEPKYQHPTDNSLKWVGRGAYPKWVKDFLAGGGGLVDLEIKK